MTNLFLLLSFFFLNKPLNDSSQSVYIMKISWKDDFHGKLSSTWLLRKTEYDLEGFNILRQKVFSFEITPLIVPLSTLDYMACCEMKNSNAFNSTHGRKLFDSLGEKYSQKYDKYYFHGGQMFNKKKSYNLTKDTLKEFRIQFYKVVADFCICKTAYSNPVSSYTDTVANINNIYKYESIKRKEKVRLKKIVLQAFSNKMVQETLEFYRIPSK